MTIDELKDLVFGKIIANITGMCPYRGSPCSSCYLAYTDKKALGRCAAVTVRELTSSLHNKIHQDIMSELDKASPPLPRIYLPEDLTSFPECTCANDLIGIDPNCIYCSKGE